MLWLCLHPQNLPLAALMPPAGSDGVVTARRGSRRWVVGGTRPGIAPGTDLGQAQLLHPELASRPRDSAAEREALRHLAYWAYRYGQPVFLELREAPWEYGLPLPAVWVEIGSSLRLFGGMEGLLAQLRREAAAELPMALHLGVACTPEAALLAARCGQDLVLQSLQAQQDWLDAQPLQALPLPPERIAALGGCGFQCLGELLDLPVETLARRFDAALVDYLSRLSGRRPDPRRALQPPTRYRRRFELFGEVEHTEGLLFPVRRLLGELQHYLRARDTGVQALTLHLSHPDREASVVELSLAAATRDAGYLFLLLRERLERVELPAAVRELSLEAARFAAPSVLQLDLFDRQPQQARAWQETVEKLIARLGVDAVWNLGLVADHRPERAWLPLPPGIAGPQAMPPRVSRPHWLIDPPRALSGPPSRLGPPERIDSGWWDGEEVARDYYVAEAGDGARLWVYRDRGNGAWFLQGLWA